jgi:hypothetical protein
MGGNNNWAPPPWEPRQPSLALRIIRSLVDSADGSNLKFLPNSCLDTLVTKATIQEELELATSSLGEIERRELIEWIHTYAKKLFLITIRCGLSADNARDSMRCFRYFKKSDESLPLLQTTPDATEEPCFNPAFWTELQIDNFSAWQWAHLAPVFDPSEYDYPLADRCILPFVKKDENIKQGAFSWVHRVEIHPEYNGHDALLVRLITSLTRLPLAC